MSAGRVGTPRAVPSDRSDVLFVRMPRRRCSPQHL